MKKAIVVSIIGASMLLSAGAGVYAGTNMKEIKAYLNNDIKVKVNGKTTQLLDTKGNVLTPISYDDTTYVPIRAISGLLNVAVDYDPATDSVLLGEKVEGTPINANQTFYTSIKDPNLTKYKGTDYKEVLIAKGNGGSNFQLTPNKKFQKLYLQVAAIEASVNLEFKDTQGHLLKEVTVSIEDGMKTIELNVAGLEEVNVFYGTEGVFVPVTTSYYK
ncbi:stalk domain-containing protein [Paenibacillus sp. KN14-4R]|uniref:stalk domain-containing protein n=1 Tax=Paenibacillus sp. KN14-4R TaxID=3445773 RepID=UPI003FA0F805